MLFNEIMSFKVDEIKKYNINKLEFFLKYSGNLWELSYHYLDIYKDANVIDCQEFESFTKEKWVFDNEYSKIILRPSLPDKPILTDFKNPTSVLPGESINLYEQIICFIDILLISDKKEICIKKLSTLPTLFTWLGDPMDGELCYHDESEAVFDKKLIDYQHGAVICPIHINNKSDKVYDLKQMIIRTEFLAIYDHKDKLWSDKMKIDFLGEDKDNALDIISDFHKDDKYTKLTPARDDVKQSHRLLKRLGNIRSLMS